MKFLMTFFSFAIIIVFLFLTVDGILPAISWVMVPILIFAVIALISLLPGARRNPRDFVNKGEDYVERKYNLRLFGHKQKVRLPHEKE